MDINGKQLPVMYNIEEVGAPNVLINSDGKPVMVQKAVDALKKSKK